MVSYLVQQLYDVSEWDGRTANIGPERYARRDDGLKQLDPRVLAESRLGLPERERLGTAWRKRRGDDDGGRGALDRQHGWCIHCAQRESRDEVQARRIDDDRVRPSAELNMFPTAHLIPVVENNAVSMHRAGVWCDESA
nr:hypothetical protein [Rhodococcus rhodnii]